MLFGVVLLVLASEGLFVVNPAVKRIQRFMDDLERSHVELKDYALEARAQQQRAPGLRVGGVARSSGAAPEGSGLQRPAAVTMRRRRSTTRGETTSTGSRTPRPGCKRLINDLLTYCRVATKAQPFVPTDLVSITREVVVGSRGAD